MDILELKVNIEKVYQNIDAACSKCGRNPSDVIICAASKMQNLETLKLLDTLNLIPFVGENKVQEFREKYVEFSNMKWHFIGQLQTNKVKYIVGKAALIHSVDREGLLIEINRVAAARGIVQDILLEVNISGEESKGGVSANQLPGLAEMASTLKNIKLRGIMSVLPKGEESELRIYFSELETLYKNLINLFPNEKIDYLSVGMSGDYELAVEYGANIVRIGSAIFGQRDYQTNCI